MLFDLHLLHTSLATRVTPFPDPYFDDPHFESTTLVTLTKYVHPSMYDDLAEKVTLPAQLKADLPSSSVCQIAYRVSGGSHKRKK
jgi:hypothetical protein